MDKKEQFVDAIKSILTPMLDDHRQSLVEDVNTAVDSKLKDFQAKPIIAHDNSIDDPKGGFKAFWQFCRDVAKAEKSGNRNVSKELVEWDQKSIAIQKAAGTGLLEGDGEFGGYLIPTEFRNQLLIAVETENQLLPLTTSMPMGSAILEIPCVNGFDESGGTVWGGVQMLWVDEEGAYTEKRPKFGKIQLKLKKLTGLAYASDEILSDSPITMEPLLRQGFANALNFEYNRVLTRGTGAGTPMGILNAPCLVSVAKETGQDATTIKYENVLNMRARIFGLQKAYWMANPDCLPQLATMSLAVGTGGVPVYMPAGGASTNTYDTLFGRPIIWNEQCSAVGTVGDIALCDWSQYLVGRRAIGADDVRFDQSIHLKFDVGQVAFRLTTRLDGQPWWSAAYTPPQSTKTRSPFVVLATRA